MLSQCLNTHTRQRVKHTSLFDLTALCVLGLIVMQQKKIVWIRKCVSDFDSRLS